MRPTEARPARCLWKGRSAGGKSGRTQDPAVNGAHSAQLDLREDRAPSGIHNRNRCSPVSACERYCQLPSLRHRDTGNSRKIARRRLGRGDMSRELGPVEARVCRIVITLLGITVLVFVVLSAIEFLFNPSPRPRTPQSQPMNKRRRKRRKPHNTGRPRGEVSSPIMPPRSLFRRKKCRHPRRSRGWRKLSVSTRGCWIGVSMLRALLTPMPY